MRSGIFCRIDKINNPRRSEKNETFINSHESHYKTKYLIADIMTSESQPKFLAEKIAELAGNQKVSHENRIATGNEKLRPLDTFGVEVGALRRRHGLSIEELAIKANVDMDTLFAIEFGTAPLEEVLQHINAITFVFGKSSQHLPRLLLRLILD